MSRISFAILSSTALALLAAQASAARTPLLRGKDLLTRVVGNTIYFHSPSEDVFEYLAEDGSIHGESSVHGKYRAHWRLFERNSFCFQHDDPMASGCVGVRLDGGKIQFLRRDGVVEGPFELLPGNLRML